MENSKLTAFRGVRVALLAALAFPLGAFADTIQVPIETSDQQINPDGDGLLMQAQDTTNAFPTGRVGFHSEKGIKNSVEAQWLRLDVGDIEIDLS